MKRLFLYLFLFFFISFVFNKSVMAENEWITKKNSKSNIDEAIKFCTNFIVSGVKANQNV